ncbi:MAG: helix-turn-helix domain-containing protein [Neisseria sp.]|nr:helix-turn-helix domain-containing protein [Neisseria sp.]
MKNFQEITNIREIRKQSGLNQQEFWGKLGVTQSGGSRYESGRNMPRPVRELLRLVYLEKLDLEQIKRADLDVVALLQEREPALYESLLKEVSK